MGKISNWVEWLYVLSEIAKIDLQTAYTWFLNIYKHKFNLLRKVDQVILTKLILAVIGGIIITENVRRLLSLAPRLGGLGVPTFEEFCEIEYQNSIITSEHLCNHITGQFRRHEPDPELNDKKKQIKSTKNDRQKKILELIRNEISSEERKKNLNLKIGASSWLATLPIKEEGYIPNM